MCFNIPAAALKYDLDITTGVGYNLSAHEAARQIEKGIHERTKLAFSGKAPGFESRQGRVSTKKYTKNIMWIFTSHTAPLPIRYFGTFRANVSVMSMNIGF
jgi:hypothetical protein